MAGCQKVSPVCRYYEFQMNALGTIYEVFYIWQNEYTRESRFNTEEFNLIDRHVDVIGGFQDISRFEKHRFTYS